MKLSSNMYQILDVFGIDKTLSLFAKNDITAIDFSFDMPIFYAEDKGKDFYINLKKKGEDLGIKFPQAHAPYSSSFEDKERTDARFWDIVRSIENASYLGVENLVVHPFVHLEYEKNKEEMFCQNVEFYNKLKPIAKDFNVKIAIENICSKYKSSVSSSAERLINLLSTLDDDIFTVCFDIGHSFVCGFDPAEEIEKLGDKLKCIHVHDNDSTEDYHFLPFYGKIDWEKVLKALATVGYQGNLSFEAGPFIKSVPNALRKDCLTYMSKIGKYLIERFDFYKNQKITNNQILANFT